MNKKNNNSKYYLYGIIGVIAIGLLFIHSIGMLSTIQQPMSQTSYQDEGNITLNGVFYNHHITLFAPASQVPGSGGSGTWSKKFYISKVYNSGAWIPTIVYIKIYHSDTILRYSSDDAVWYQIYDNGKLWQTSGKVLTNYDSTPAFIVTAYNKVSQNSNMYIGIENSELASFYIAAISSQGGQLPAARFKIPPVIVKTQKQLQSTKYQGSGYWNDDVRDYHYLYLSHMGGQLITPGLRAIGEDGEFVGLWGRTYWYQNIFSGLNQNPIVTIAFNVPDSNGNGVDDLNDIAPHDPQIKTLNEDKAQLKLLTSELKTKQSALDTAKSNLNTVNVQLNAKLILITQLNTDINKLNIKLTNEGKQYQSLQSEVNNLQKLSMQLNALVIQSTTLTKNIGKNLNNAAQLITTMDTKLINMENIIQSSSLTTTEKNNLINMISSIRTSNQQLSVLIGQTQKLVTQQESLQQIILSKNKIIEQQETTINQMTTKLNNANVKLILLGIELKSRQNAILKLNTELKLKQNELNNVNINLTTVKNLLNTKLELISQINTELNSLNTKLVNEGKQYQLLKSQVIKLEDLSNQLNTLVTQSTTITNNIGNNLNSATNTIVAINIKLVNMKNVIETSNLPQNDKTNLVNMINSILTNNQQLLTLIKQTQSLVSQQKILQQKMISKNKIITQQENSISDLTSQLANSNTKLIGLTVQLKAKQKALNIANDKLININNQLSGKIKIISELNKNAEALNSELSNLGIQLKDKLKEILNLNNNANQLNNNINQEKIQYTILLKGINNLQNMSNQMNTLILQSSSITQNISNNLDGASALIIGINTKIIKMKTTIQASSLTENNKYNLLNMLNSIKVSNNQLLVIIQQTQSLIIQQKSLQLFILNQNKLISQKEAIINNQVKQLDNNDKLIYNMKNNNIYQYAIILIFGIVISILSYKLYEEEKKNRR